MSEEEHLAAGGLGVTGSSAWGRLHNDVTSQLMTVSNCRPATRCCQCRRSVVWPPTRTLQPCRAAYDAELRGVADDRGADLRRDERDQGRSERVEPPTPMVVATRRIVVRQQRESCDVRCDAVGGGRCAARPAALDANQGGAARSRSRRWSPLVGPCLLGHCPRSTARCRGTTASRWFARRSRATATGWAGSSTAASTSDGSTPNLATARRAARSVRRSSTIAPSCC